MVAPVELIEKLFGRPKCLIGVVHLMPLPGSPRWGGRINEVVSRAVSDASALERAGFNGLILENYGDAPFSRDFAGRGAVAAMGAVGARVAEKTALPLGVNVLRNDALSAVAVAASIGARFIRVNVHTGAAITDQGLIEGAAMETMTAIRNTAAELVVFADVLVKHASPLGETSVARAARDAVERGLAGALIVTGEATGSKTSLRQVDEARSAVPGVPVLVGSGVTAQSVKAVMAVADGAIVGSAAMRDGGAGHEIDAERARNLASTLEGDWLTV